jgi:excinuclease ABC subunit B
VGINLLREGLDLPEVSLVAILDADKEGFLRSTTSLIQTIGRAARNVSGEVHMYADNFTDSMTRAIEETNRRRDKQIAYNKEHGIDPKPLRKRISDITELLVRESDDTDDLVASSRKISSVPVGVHTKTLVQRPQEELVGLIESLTEQMRTAASQLHFELAARLRDEIAELKRELRDMGVAGVS